MTLIKCPNCGRTVLSVASVCPACAVPLTRERPPHTWGGTLTECRRCGHPVTTEASVCPHCAVRRPGRPAIPAALLAAFTVVLASTVTLGVIVPRMGTSPLPSAQPIRAAPPAARRVAGAPDTVPAARDTTPPGSVARDTATVVAAPPRDSQPPDTTGKPVVPPAVASPAVAPPEPDPIPKPSDPARTPLTRWVGAQWVNVRAGPGDDSPVVAQLRPGQRVEAGAPTPDGWQMVYVDGTRVGYVARSLLTSEQPM